ncbi:unnamed protein product [Psylliodes chrysocephalus]|uniref:Uncharacterized protein n=1 Tax=Psylliodes chrysocephalus TaxID=3402493 RepID=A0A9P0DBV1_9CUCU|nr:unnamed protein product [Psylliodes chrysocephala]
MGFCSILTFRCTMCKYVRTVSTSDINCDKKRLNFEDKNYGPTCEKPDMSSADFEEAKACFLSSLRKAKEEIESIEARTKEQANNFKWVEMRKTPSHFGESLHWFDQFFK